MLQKLNERIQGLIAWVVIILIAVTFALFGVDYYMHARQATGVIVEVNKKPITEETLELVFRRTRQFRQDEQVGALNDQDLKQQLLNDLIKNQVVLQAAKKSGFDVSPTQANAAIISIPQFNDDGHFSTERYQQALNNALFTPESFQREVQQGMLLNQQRFAFIGTAFSLPNEVKRFVNLYMQTRNYRYVVIPSTLFMSEIKPTDEAIKAYYTQHERDFLTPEQVSIRYVLLSLNDIKKQLTVTEEELQRYYEDNQQNYLTPARWQVAHIQFALPANASTAEQEKVKQLAEKTYNQLQQQPGLFSEKVKTLSADKLSVSNKGVLPWIVAGKTPFDSAFIQLTKPGQITAPILFAHGYEIFKLKAYEPAKLKPFELVKTEIKEQLLADKAQEKFSTAVEQLGDLSYESPDSLQPAAKALDIPIRKTEHFSATSGKTPLTQNKQVIKAAFSPDVLQLGNNSEPLQLQGDKVIVLRVDDHLQAQKKPLSAVKSIIIKKLVEEKGRQQAAKLGKQLQKMNDEAHRSTLLDSYHLQWKTVTGRRREDSDVNAEINELAFTILKVGQVKGGVLSSGDYAVVALQAIEKGEMNTLDKEHIASIAQQLEATYGIMDYDLYVNYLMKHANIVKQGKDSV